MAWCRLTPQAQHRDHLHIKAWDSIVGKPMGDAVETQANVYQAGEKATESQQKEQQDSLLQRMYSVV